MSSDCQHGRTEIRLAPKVKALGLQHSGGIVGRLGSYFCLDCGTELVFCLHCMNQFILYAVAREPLHPAPVCEDSFPKVTRHHYGSGPHPGSK